MTTLDNSTDRLARAASHVSATDMGRGYWAHYAEETRTWYVVPATELESLCDYLDADDEDDRRDAYSLWCADCRDAVEMDHGWTPDDGIAIVETMPDHLRSSHRTAGNWGRWPTNGADRIVMSLAAAEEAVDSDPDGYAHVVEQ